MDAALREAEFGNFALARETTAAALALARGRYVEGLAALSLARVGDAPRAKVLADDVAKRFPADTQLNAYWLPTVHAAVELTGGQPAKALNFLQSAQPYELATPSPFAIGTLYPVYVRGYAYLGLHRGDEAAAQFQRILDHPGIIQNSPLAALAHLGLARAQTMNGNTAAARTAYQDFLALWKDADPDIPILKQAKVEYAKLQ